jgi:hypothetical protein
LFLHAAVTWIQLVKLSFPPSFFRLLSDDTIFIQCVFVFVCVLCLLLSQKVLSLDPDWQQPITAFFPAQS